MSEETETARVKLDLLREIRDYAATNLHDCCYWTNDQFVEWLDERIAALEGES